MTSTEGASSRNDPWKEPCAPCTRYWQTRRHPGIPLCPDGGQCSPNRPTPASVHWQAKIRIMYGWAVIQELCLLRLQTELLPTLKPADTTRSSVPVKWSEGGGILLKGLGRPRSVSVHQSETNGTGQRPHRLARSRKVPMS